MVEGNTSLYEAYLSGIINDSDVLPLAGLFADSHLPYYLDRMNMNDELKQKNDYRKIAIDLLESKYG